MPLNSLSKAYRKYIRERRYWRRRSRIEANRPVNQGDSSNGEPGPLAVGGRATLYNRPPIRGQVQDRDMPVVVGQEAPRRTRMEEVFSSEASTDDQNSEPTEMMFVPPEMEQPPLVQRQRAIAHERRHDSDQTPGTNQPQRQGQ